MSRAASGRSLRIRTLLLVVAGFAGAFGLVRGFFGLDIWSRIMVVLIGGSAIASLLFLSGIPAVGRLVARWAVGDDPPASGAGSGIAFFRDRDDNARGRAKDDARPSPPD